MSNILVYSAAHGNAAQFAVQHLTKRGIHIVDHPTPEISNLLLDVPARDIPDGLLDRLPENITVVGGNLDRPALEAYRKIDLLKHEGYLAKNAAITADCAVRVAASRIHTVFSDVSVLVIGWGRIGKHLSHLLKQIGCHVTVAARKESDRAMLEAMGYLAVDPGYIKDLNQYSILFNTVPSLILRKAQLLPFRDLLKIDLASVQGLECPDVVWARGLPGLYAPESSGKLIADIFLQEVFT